MDLAASHPFCLLACLVHCYRCPCIHSSALAPLGRDYTLMKDLGSLGPLLQLTLCLFAGLAYQGKDIVFRFIIKYRTP